MEIRDLTTIGDCQRAVELQRQVWGASDEDVVPASLLIAVVERGGILAGAFEGGTLVGLVCSLPGLRDGRVSQWSHMLGVLQSHRGRGLGRRLKLEQRRRTLAMGLDLIEWTFDPLMALNASLNIERLGAIAWEYAIDVYGASSSPLHRGTPTDRLVAEWWIRSPRVEARLEGTVAVDRRAFGVAVPANRCEPDDRIVRCTSMDLEVDADRIALEIPADFMGLVAEAPAVALDWRLRTRQLFLEYLRRGYGVTGFRLLPERRCGVYLLDRDPRPG